MDLFLTIAPLVIGTAATLAAFGGETWIKGSNWIWERITLRGWVSLACLMLTLILGVAKGLNDHAENVERENKEKDAAAEAKKEANQRQSDLIVQLNSTKEELANETGQLKGLGVANKAIRGQLDLSKETLATTRSELTMESETNLLTILATSGYNATQLIVWIPLTEAAGGEAGSTLIYDTLAPSAGGINCDGKTVPWIYSFDEQSTGVLFKILRPQHKPFMMERLEQPNSDIVLENGEHPIFKGFASYYLPYAGQRSTNERALHIETEIKKAIPTTDLYQRLQQGYNPAFSIVYRSDADIDDNLVFTHPLPRLCGEAIHAFLKKAFDGGLIIIRSKLKDHPDIAIYFPLKATPGNVGPYESIDFNVAASPRIFYTKNAGQDPPVK